MLLKLLYDFAHSRNLLDDLAFAEKPVRWIIHLNPDGSLRGQGPTETTGEKKNPGKSYLCPRIVGDTNSGKVADFLAEGIDGMFGLSPNPQKPKDADKLAAKHKHFWDQLQECYEAIHEPALDAVLKFHKSLGNGHPPFLKLENGNWVVISSQGEQRKLGNDEFSFSVSFESYDDLLLENERIRDFWRAQFSILQEDNNEERAAPVQGICLVTGESAVIARTHNPKIKGIPNTQPSGAKIVSFEKSCPSFSSYGFNQSYNAPVSREATTAYCIAAGWLLSDPDHHHKIEVRKDNGKSDGVAVCFWARESKKASSFFARMLNRPDPASVASFLKAPWAGIDRELARHDRFYSVTLSGNAGRIVVRHWVQTTLEAARENVRRWFADLEITTYGNPIDQEKRERKGSSDSGEPEDAIPPLALFRLACTTVRDAKELRPEILTQLYRASLEGTTPSVTLLKPILNRLDADLCKFGDGVLETPISNKAIRAMVDSKTPIPPPGQSRMALIRLILNRNQKEGEPMIEPQVFETHDPAYNCGRLLAVFDSLQRSAHGKSFDGATVAERYFGSASTTPNTAFSLLWRLHQHHLKKLRQQGEKGQRAAAKIKDSITEIASLFGQTRDGCPPEFPRYFTPVQQGRFALGFYQQMAARKAAIEEYLKKKKANELKPEEINDELEIFEDQ